MLCCNLQKGTGFQVYEGRLLDALGVSRPGDNTEDAEDRPVLKGKLGLAPSLAHHKL